MSRRWFFALSAFLAALVPAGADPGPVGELNSVLASVNGEPITLGEVLKETQLEEARLLQLHPGASSQEPVLALRRRVVDDLIDRKLVLQDFQKQPFEIPLQYVESMIDQVALDSGLRSRSELERALRASGSTLEALRRKALDSVIQQAMFARRAQLDVNLTPHELYSYYQEHPAEFTTPERLRLALLLLKPDASAAAREAAGTLSEHPERFDQVTRLYSDGPAREQGGDLGYVVRAQLRPEFAEALKEPVPDRVYGPVKTAEGTYYLKLTDYRPARRSAFAEVAGPLRRKLEEELHRQSRERYLRELRSRAVIRYLF